jgi:Penicillin binding protein transpeptidase domain/Penicillin-binding Protein dimerisation domain/NTF2-like N-terminal transpeptidase domain
MVTARRRRWPRAAAVVVLVLAVAGAGVAVLRFVGDTASSRAGPTPTVTARAFVAAWEKKDLAEMYRLVSRPVRRRVSFQQFASAYATDARTSTLRRVAQDGPMHVAGMAVTVPMVASTDAFGHVSEPTRLPMVDTPRGYRVVWSPALAFPGLRRGEQLVARSHPPTTRGVIKASDGTILAEGPPDDRVYPQGSPFSLITGYVKPPDPEQVAAREAAGWPASRPYGQGGLEQSLDRILAGAPRLDLVARSATGKRVLAVNPGRAPHGVTTTLDVPLQKAAATALGSRYGGIVVLQPRTGAVEADAGLGMDALQPPGSSFKTITASAALEGGKATLSSTYPYARFVVLDGWHLRNFHHEDCGGSLVLAFAVSCNSVFAPLADQVGAAKLVAMADGFGFNQKPSIAYPVPTSVTPKPGAMDSDLSLGVAGIGQGGVDASPLQMASVAQTIGGLGIQRPPFIVHTPSRHVDRQPERRVIPASVAEDVRSMMEAVVTEGTGISAAIPGVAVAGKTGTAEVGPHRPSDAWFIAFAPAENPTVAVAVLIVNGGVGGTVAAPIAREVMEAALGQ